MNVKNLFVSVLLLMMATTVQALPAWRGWHQHVQPDGTVVEFQLLGDEHCHAMVAKNGRQLRWAADGRLEYATERALDFGEYYRQRAKASPCRVMGGVFPTKGTVKGLVLMVQFADNEFQPDYTRELFTNMMNQEGFSDYEATGSARDYFIAQSMGQFTPEYDVVGPIKLPFIMQHYGQNDSQGNERVAFRMIQDACQIAHDSLNVDFSQYDFNDDGDVDFVYVIYAGFGESYGASTNTIWPHASTLSAWGGNITLDEKRVERYACSCELKYTSGTQLEGIGTFCHEFGHVLGLPDIYNTQMQSRTQLGQWDVMDTGAYNNESRTPPAHSAFERYSLGWLDFIDIDTPAEVMELEELTEHNVAYRIVTPNNPDEFFTLENRQLIGWDSYLPGGGLMILHINYDEGIWDRNAVNNGVNPCYDLVEADGNQGQNLPTNLFPTPTNDMFTDYSTPNSLAWDGTPTEKGITNIRVEDGVVKFRFMKDRLPRPIGLEISDVTSTSAHLQWDEVDDADSYQVVLHEVLPNDINPLLISEDFNSMTTKNGYEDLGNSLDSYTQQPGWTGTEVYEAGERVRIGAYGISGRLITPAFSLPEINEGDSCIVVFHAASYPGKSVSYTVSLQDATTGETLATESLKAKKTEEEQVLVFHQMPQKGKILIETQKERLFLNDLRVVADSTSGVWNVGPKAWTVDSIPETEYVVSGLVPGRTYYCYVRALSKEALRSSLPSVELTFTTEEGTVPTSLQNQQLSLITHKPSSTIQNYDLLGRQVGSSHSHIHPLPFKTGIFILRTGNNSRKVIVR